MEASYGYFGGILLLAVLVQGVGLYLQYRKWTYLSHPHYFVWLYVLGCVAMLEVAAGLAGPVTFSGSLWQALVWLSMVGFTMGVNVRKPLPRHYREAHPASYFLSFGPTFVVVKMVDILFQQVFLLLFVMGVFRVYPDVLAVSVITAAVFVAAHIPLLFLQKKVSLLHLVGATVGIGIVPWVLLRVEHGFWWLYVGHWGFYVVVRLMLGIRSVRRGILGAELTVEA